MQISLLVTMVLLAQSSVHPISGTRSMAWIENKGQWRTNALYIGRLPGMLVRIEPDALGLQLFENGDPSRGVYARLVFEGLAKDVTIEAERVLPGTFNWFLGSDPSRWVRNAGGFGRVCYRGLYEGIDLAIHESGGTAKYDIIVRPGADLSQFAIRCEGIDGLRIDDKGDLCLITSIGDLIQPAPLTWQVSESGERRETNCRYRKIGEHTFGLHASDQRPEHHLVVDPEMIWGSYIGSTTNPSGIGDGATTVSIGADGQLIVGGRMAATDFPTTPGAYQSGSPAGYDCFAARFRSKDGSLIYSSVFGGNSLNDRTFEVEVDALGRATVAGATDSSDFPTTPGAFDTSKDSFNGSAFVLRLTSAGDDLEYSTLLEGANGEGATSIYSLSLADTGAAVVGGATVADHYPTTPGAFRESMPGLGAGFVTRLDPTGSALEWSTFLGGASVLEIHGVAIDGSGEVTVAGLTDSQNFPTTPGSFQSDWFGGVSSKAFVTRFTPDGSALVWSTFLGGGGPGVGGDALASAVAIAPDGDAVVVGYTTHRDFPTTPDAVQPTFPQCCTNPTAFATRLTSDGSALVFSTFLGTPFPDFGEDVVVDEKNRATIIGSTNGNTFPISPDAFDPTPNGNTDTFLVRLAQDGTLLHSTYLGGVGPDDGKGVDVEGDRVAVAGASFGPGFPTTPGAFQPSFQGGQSDGYVALLRFPEPSLDEPRRSGAPRQVGATIYCTGKTSSLGCVPFLTHAGHPSSSSAQPFRVFANDVLPTQVGTLLYSVTGRGKLDFHGGSLCIKTPLAHTRVVSPRMMGDGSCNGILSIDFNRRIQAQLDPSLTAGQRVNGQWRLRDPADPAGFGDGLSDAIEFRIAP